MFRAVRTLLPALLATFLLLPCDAIAQMPLARALAPVAATPPMGWNSWDAYGLTITEQQFRDNVNVLREKLKPAGYTYAVIDEGWFFFNPEARPKPDTLHYAVDRYGRYVPVPERFPSAGVATGMEADAVPDATADARLKLAATVEPTSFAPLAAWVHAQGLKFGIHIVRGIPRASVERNLPVEGSGFHAQDVADTHDACPWDPTNWGVQENAAGQAWYDALLRQYAAWGVDLLKVDCIANNPYKPGEIRMIRRAIDKAGRPMVLSLSPGPTGLEHAPEVRSLSNMWRISNDVWDVWDAPAGKDFPQPVKGQFARTAQWAEQSGPGHWPDADMLPLGELRPVPGWGKPRSTRLTPDEQQSLLTLWAMARSPLIVGANLTLLDEPTLKLLTNRDLLRIDQDATSGKQILMQENLVGWQNLVAWRAELPRTAGTPASTAFAYFNTGDAPLETDIPESALSVPSPLHTVRDVWAGRNLPLSGKPFEHLTHVRIAAHGCLLLIVN